MPFSLADPVISLPNVSIGNSGALAAATSAGRIMRRQRVHLIKGATLNGQMRERPPTNTPIWSNVSKKDGCPWEHSPSYSDVLQATSKPTPASTQTSLNSTSNTRQPFPLQSVMNNMVNAPSMISCSTDDTVGGTTSSLVSHFESKHNTKKSIPIVHSVRYVTKPASAFANTTPTRPTTKPALPTTNSLSAFHPSLELGKDAAAPAPSSTVERGAAATAAQSAAQIKACTRRLGHSAHSTNLSRTMPEHPVRPGLEACTPSDLSLTNSRNIPQISLGGDTLVFSPAKPATAPRISQIDSISPSSKPTSAPYSRPHLPATSLRSFEKKVDSLANTIVAASLASSRAPSPTKTPPPPPRRHKTHSLLPNHHSQGQTSRTPSPAKAMRQTMREPLPSGDDVEHRRKGFLKRKHPHKHHEGDRKRYRAIVTERESRRYDGVWAANKGLWMDTNSSNSVLNIVVRDIWSRSRLPSDVLANIWDLVNIHDSDRLQRSEFIIGMWLIDQRLKGRKLPTIVSESLWNSVLLLHGVNVVRHQN